METIKVLLGGDICSRHIKTDIDTAFCDRLFRDLKPITSAADLSIANLECVLCKEDICSPIPKSGPGLRANENHIKLLKVAGFDCVGLANNHLGDMGYAPIEATMALLDQNGIAHFGGGADKAAAYRAYRTECKGISLSFLNVCENEFGIATETTPGSAGFDLKYLYDRIQEEKAVSEFVIVYFHGGNEQNPVPAPSVVDRYRLLTDFGADAVIAGHTHCMQGAEVYRGKPIIYSMGNLFFPYVPARTQENPWLYGYLTELQIERGKPISYRLIPYVLEEECTYLRILEGTPKQRIMDYLKKLSDIIADPNEVRRYYEAWATHLGAWYISCFAYDKGYEADTLTYEQLCELAPVKNLLSCEAHNDLLKTLLNLEYENRFAQANAFLPTLLELQKMPNIYE